MTAHKKKRPDKSHIFISEFDQIQFFSLRIGNYPALLFELDKYIKKDRIELEVLDNKYFLHDLESFKS